MLYPRESEKREVKDLSGIWRFKVDKENKGLREEWYKKPLEDAILMPVPSSYNDITQDISIRDHIGYVWYERKFFVPFSWKDKRIFIRVGSASHYAILWINGEKIVEHKGGFLPFEGEITPFVEFGKENRLVIAVNNILDWNSLPPGEIIEYKDPMHPEGYKTQEYYFDFYNYSGIHRPVFLYTTPKNYISDIKAVTNINGEDGEINYEVKIEGEKERVEVIVFDKNGKEIGKEKGEKGKLIIKNCEFWSPENPYLYTLKVNTYNGEELEDSYSLNIGIRTIEVKEDKLLLNGKPIYLKGFGKHEDSDIRGKGYDPVIAVKDFNLLKWINANSFRTSHYPYAEEILDLADQYGILVIDEAPAVGMNFFNRQKKVFCEERINEKTLQYHIQVMREMINRDKNHPCVIMWSVANEPADYEEEAEEYFKRIIEEVRELDPTRPVTIVESSGPLETKTARYVDIISVNRYYAWYTDMGHLELIEFQLEKELRTWYELYKKPILLSEFGADTIAGFHQDPPVMFTEEFQVEFLKKYGEVLDKLPFVIGEHVWNFADFATKQHVIRVVGNKKGVFTRQRQPKASALFLRERWANK
ncbi:MAG: beta-glucuronidase [Dictyoglomaceae bacterium]